MTAIEVLSRLLFMSMHVSKMHQHFLYKPTDQIKLALKFEHGNLD